MVVRGVAPRTFTLYCWAMVFCFYLGFDPNRSGPSSRIPGTESIIVEVQNHSFEESFYW